MEKEYYPSTLGASSAGRAYTTGETAMAPKQPALGSLYEALKRISEAAGMARNTADQLCGSQPESIGKDALDRPSSYFGQLDDIAASIGIQADRIIGDMQRILGKL